MLHLVINENAVLSKNTKSMRFARAMAIRQQLEMNSLTGVYIMQKKMLGGAWKSAEEKKKNALKTGLFSFDFFVFPG